LKTELIDIGTAKLEVCTQGEGDSIVVIETGMGDTFYDWDVIVSNISKKAKVLMYHRQGYGRSTLNEEPRTTERIAKDLSLLLEKVCVKEPIILVGHSFGGLCALHFAKIFPNKMRGLILVDSSPAEYYKIEDLKVKLPAIQFKYPTYKTLEKMKRYSYMTDCELTKEFNRGLSSEIQEEINDFLCSANIWKAQVSEFENMISSGIVIETLGNLNDITIKVIGRDGEVEINNLISVGIPKNEAKELEDMIQELNKAKVGYSTNSEFILAKGASHRIHIDCPDIIVRAIEQLL